MPYITKTRFEEIVNNPEKATKEGDWNALYSNEFSRIIRENGVKYSTLHLISRLVERPETEPGVWRLTNGLRPHVKETDLRVARTEAVAELRRRVFNDYEDSKRQNEENYDPYSVENLTVKTEA